MKPNLKIVTIQNNKLIFVEQNVLKKLFFKARENVWYYIKLFLKKQESDILMWLWIGSLDKAEGVESNKML